MISSGKKNKGGGVEGETGKKKREKRGREASRGLEVEKMQSDETRGERERRNKKEGGAGGGSVCGIRRQRERGRTQKGEGVATATAAARH